MTKERGKGASKGKESHLIVPDTATAISIMAVTSKRISIRLSQLLCMPRRISVWPVAIHTRTPEAMGINVGSFSVQIELLRLYFWPTVTWEASFGPRGFGYKRLPGLFVLRDKGQHPCNAQRRENGDTDAQPALQQ